MRNLSRDLANGTRMVIRELGSHVIKAEITQGKQKGKLHLIPRIIMVSTSSTNLPFRLRRRQFPVKPCFAMTINKSQGQTLENVGICLLTDVFSHGQLYVAMSRVTNRSKLKILSLSNMIRNIVYNRVLV